MLGLWSMKNIVMGVFISFAFVGVASASFQFIATTTLWGKVTGYAETLVYRLPDAENGTVCYVAQQKAEKNTYSMDMECVKVR